MKLVRDNIPVIAPHREFRKAEEGELSQLVSAKVLEECQELTAAQTFDEKVEELADVVEILVKYARVNNINWNDLTKARDKKNQEKGKFNKDWVLVK